MKATKFFRALWSLFWLISLLMAVLWLVAGEYHRATFWAVFAIVFILLENQEHRTLREERED